MRRRFVFFAGNLIVHAGPAEVRRELWIGIELESDGPVDVQAFSQDHGFDLIPVERFSPEHLASIGVESFTPMKYEKDLRNS
jgi:hypothetical protein